MAAPDAAPPGAPEATDELGRALLDLGFQRSPRYGAAVWEGSLDGRRVVLTISRQGRTRYAGEVRYRQTLGFRLRIDVATAVPTRLFFVKRGFADSGFIRWIYRLKRQTVLEGLPAVLDGYRVVTRDPQWAGRLVAESRAMADVAALLNEKVAGALRGSVYLTPRTLHYGSPLLQWPDFTVDWVGSVLERLGRIAAVADGLPEPALRLEPSAWERLGRQRPAVVALLLIGCLGGGLTFLGLVFAAILGWIAAASSGSFG